MYKTTFVKGSCYYELINEQKASDFFVWAPPSKIGSSIQTKQQFGVHTFPLRSTFLEKVVVVGDAPCKQSLLWIIHCRSFHQKTASGEGLDLETFQTLIHQNGGLSPFHRSSGDYFCSAVEHAESSLRIFKNTSGERTILLKNFSFTFSCRKTCLFCLLQQFKKTIQWRPKTNL